MSYYSRVERLERPHALHRPLVAHRAERDKLERAMETLFADTVAISI